MKVKIIAKNKRATFDYFLEDKIEVGIVLQGTEVKSLRLGKVSLAEAFVYIDDHQEAWINNMNIAHYEFGNIHNHTVDRKRKLLMHKKEIVRFAHNVKAKGFTIVPCAIYFKKGRAKLEIALGKAKKKHDKREVQKKRDVTRRLQRGEFE